MQPVILDSKHPLTRLLIQHYNVKAGHQGQEFVVNELQQKFWLISLCSAVRSAWNECQQFKNQRAMPKVPEMGSLPSYRVKRCERPFTKVGMDYFGPLQVTVGRHHEKRYGVLFTCLATRAIHLEIAHSLSTDSCIMATRRMSARRGALLEIFLDNGKNFQGTCHELKKALQDIKQDVMLQELSPRGIFWHFIPPWCPHMGGSWERLIRSVKTAISATLHERFS